MGEATPVVEMRNIKKNFGAVQALCGVNLILHHNEVLGLVGDNAAAIASNSNRVPAVVVAVCHPLSKYIFTKSGTFTFS